MHYLGHIPCHSDRDVTLGHLAKQVDICHYNCRVAISQTNLNGTQLLPSKMVVRIVLLLKQYHSYYCIVFLQALKYVTIAHAFALKLGLFFCISRYPLISL